MGTIVAKLDRLIKNVQQKQDDINKESELVVSAIY